MDIKYRYNVMGIESLAEFARVKGGFHGGCRDVYFIRALGGSASLQNEVAAADKMLLEAMESGRLYYKRLKALPFRMENNEQDFYLKVYEDWLAGDRQKLAIRATYGNDGWESGKPENEEFAAVLGQAMKTVCQAYEGVKKGISDSIRKNFVIKIAWWADSVYGALRLKWNERSCIKIVAENIAKEQEYLFYYFLTMTGADVMLLQNQADINTSEELKRLSKEIKLGEYVSWELPEPPAWQVTFGTLGAAATPASPAGAALSGTSGAAATPASPAGAALSGASGAAVSPITSPQPASSGKVVLHIPEHPGRRKTKPQNERQIVTTGNNTGSLTGSNTGNPAGRDTGGLTGGNTGSPAGRGTGGPIGSNTGNPAGRGTGSPMGSNTGGFAGSSGGSFAGNSAARIAGSVPQNRTGNVSGNNRPAQRTGAGAERREKTFEELAQLAPSIVKIAIHDNDGQIVGSGSGIMVGKAGYILTNHHVVREGRYFSVYIEEDDNAYPTDEVIKYNSVLDLAVIRIAKSLSPLPVFDGRSKLVRGQRVVAIGSPLGLFNSVSDGIISGFRTINMVDMIQFTAPTSHGSSGGAVLNMYGELIGISTAGIDIGQNINLAVPYDCINMFIQGFR